MPHINKEELGEEYMKYVNGRWGHGTENKMPTLYLSHVEITDYWLSKLDHIIKEKVEEIKQDILSLPRAYYSASKFDDIIGNPQTVLILLDEIEKYFESLSNNEK
jgi:hypothetical protein